MEEERKREELQRLYTGSSHGKAGNAKNSSGLEWMYSAPIQSQESQKDAYLMGKKYEEDKPDLREELGKTGLEVASAAGRPATDDWARTRNDPMLAMKMHEKNMLEAIAENPLKMARLKEALGIKKDKKKSKKKKEKKKGKEKKRSRSRSRSPSNKKPKKDRKRSRSRSRSSSRSRSRSPKKKEQPLLVVPAGYGLQFPGGKPPPPPRAAVAVTTPASTTSATTTNDAKPGQRKSGARLTAEEKAERLRQMTEDAAAVEASRSKRVSTATLEEQKEEEQMQGRSEDKAKFIRDLNKQVFVEGESNLSERIQSVRHTIARSANKEDV